MRVIYTLARRYNGAGRFLAGLAGNLIGIGIIGLFLAIIFGSIGLILWGLWRLQAHV